MTDLVGWIGSLMLAVCAVPQAYKSYKEGHSEGLSWGLLTLWGAGELLTLAYVLPKMDLPLIVNYLTNILLIGVMVKYKLYPKIKEK